MGTADILILAVIIIFAIKGLVTGFILEAVGILGIVLAFLFSFMIHAPVNKVVILTGVDEKMGSIITYASSWIFIYLIVFFIGMMVHKIITVVHLGMFNRIIGFIFGAIKGLVLVSVVLWTITFIMPKESKFVQDIHSSKTAKTTMAILPYVYKKLNEFAGFKRIDPFV